MTRPSARRAALRRCSSSHEGLGAVKLEHAGQLVPPDAGLQLVSSSVTSAGEVVSSGWGLNMHFFRVPYILDGPWYLTWRSIEYISLLDKSSVSCGCSVQSISRVAAQVGF